MAAAEVRLTTEQPARPALRALPHPTARGRRAQWWQRKGTARSGFRYVDARGRPLTDPAALARIRALVIPPAWTSVRIAPAARSCLQAVGVDASGRVQYLYSEQFCRERAARKFARLVEFGERLPALRRATNEHIAAAGYGRERVLAVVVRLINDVYFRVGSETSVRRYRTYGITTLRNRHVRFGSKGKLVFQYIGKHRIHQRKVVVDERLAALLREIKTIGGPKLFEYLDAQGRVHAVTPRDVNAYIKSLAGPEFSAKDFRTWGGTLLAAIALAELGPPASATAAKRNIAQAVRQVAARLGNTPTVCRGSYIHPVVFELYQRGVTLDQVRPRNERTVQRHAREYELEEIALLRLFRAA